MENLPKVIENIIINYKTEMELREIRDVLIENVKKFNFDQYKIALNKKSDIVKNLDKNFINNYEYIKDNKNALKYYNEFINMNKKIINELNEKKLLLYKSILDNLDFINISSDYYLIKIRKSFNILFDLNKNFFIYNKHFYHNS